MKVLFDTNILMNAITAREPFVQQAAQLLAHVERGHIQGFLAATTVTTLFYLLSKYSSKTLAQQQIDIILQLFEIAEVNKTVLKTAHQLNATDFEDAVLYCAASAANCQAIITRNIKDFKQSNVPVYTPDEFLTLLNSN